MKTPAQAVGGAGWVREDTAPSSLNTNELSETVHCSGVGKDPVVGALLKDLRTVSIRKAFLPLGLVKQANGPTLLGSIDNKCQVQGPFDVGPTTSLTSLPSPRRWPTWRCQGSWRWRQSQITSPRRASLTSLMWEDISGGSHSG